MSIIQYLTDTDLYKLTMMQAVFYLYPSVEVRYRFHCRNSDNISFPTGLDIETFADLINDELDHLCALRFSGQEIAYLSIFPYFKNDFLAYQ